VLVVHFSSAIIVTFSTAVDRYHLPALSALGMTEMLGETHVTEKTGIRPFWVIVTLYFSSAVDTMYGGGFQHVTSPNAYDIK